MHGYLILVPLSGTTSPGAAPLDVVPHHTWCHEPRSGLPHEPRAYALLYSATGTASGPARHIIHHEIAFFKTPKQKLGCTHQPAPTHLQHPYDKRPKISKKTLAEHCITQSSTGREWMPKGAVNGGPWRR